MLGGSVTVWTAPFTPFGLACRGSRPAVLPTIVVFDENVLRSYPIDHLNGVGK